MGKLTVSKVKSLTAPGWHGDGGTLYLVIAPRGSKQWVQRLTINGKRHDLGLGGYPMVTLDEARETAFDNRRAARRGGDPLAAKRKAKMPTFAQAAEKTHRAHRARWRSAKVADNWRQRCQKYVLPHVGDMRVDTVGREEVLRVLTPLWTSRPETGRKAREIVRSTLAWCEAHGYVQGNVAGEAIDGALPRQRRVKAHMRALPHAGVAGALAVVHASGASDAVKLALRFLVLTAARSGEARLATWDEIDIEARTWTIPAERMKANREHRVPLSDAAMAVLREAERLRDRTGLIFPSPRRKVLSDNTMSKLLRDQKIGGVVHGFRSSFRDWCGERGVDRELAEAALAHVVRGVEGAYFRSDLFERRRHAMEDWARYIAGAESAKVVALRS